MVLNPKDFSLQCKRITINFPKLAEGLQLIQSLKKIHHFIKNKRIWWKYYMQMAIRYLTSYLSNSSSLLEAHRIMGALIFLSS
jgi:hypothetical protein